MGERENVAGAGVTLSASPGLVTDHGHPAHPPVATLSVVASPCTDRAEATDGATDVAGAPVDVTAAVVARGFALVHTDTAAGLARLPSPPGWHAALDDQGWLRVGPRDAAFFEGDVAALAPTGWHAALEHRGMLVLLVCGGVDPRGRHRARQVRTALKHGRVAGAAIPCG